MESEMLNTPSGSPDFQTEFANQLVEIAPEVLIDGKIDIEKIQELLAADVMDESERYGLFWPGKKRALKTAQEPTTATLAPDLQSSKDWDSTGNIFIEGDNLEVLKILQRHYHGKIKMVYIDPPYNTGKDFIYPDNYKEGLESYLEWTRQIDEDGKRISTNSESEGRFHSNWLNMMYPRLKLARNLLTDDGVIAVHIDEHEYTNLEKVLDEIFGERNNLGTIVWDKRNPKGDSIGVSYQHEYILLYARNITLMKEMGDFTRPKENASKILEAAARFIKESKGINDESRSQFKNWMKKQEFTGGELAYNQIDDNGDVFRPVSMAWPNKKKAPDDYFVPLIHPVSGKPCPVPERGWRNPTSTMKSLLEAGEILFGADETTQPNRKYLLKNNMYENVSSLLYFGGSDDDLLDSMKIHFDNPKPLQVARKIIQAVTKENDLVLDFFAGSGTTAHAVIKLNLEDGGNRKFILVQLPEPTPEDSLARKSGFERISDITATRIEKAGLEAEESLLGSKVDTGFRKYRLIDTNFSKWKVTNVVTAGALEQHLLDLKESASDFASEDALLTEILLKQGYSLTESITTIEIEDFNLKSIGSGAVIALLDQNKKPTLNQIREFLELKPAKFIILEDVFMGDDELKTNLKQECNSREVELWTA